MMDMVVAKETPAAVGAAEMTPPFPGSTAPVWSWLAMYETFYGLKKNPFGMNPDPACLFMTPSHREAFAGLVYAISRHKGFVVLTGDAGTGKTTLLRALIRAAHNSRFSVILTPRVTPEEFLELALLDFGVTQIPESKSQRIFRLQQVLVEFHREAIAPVLIVDEAHTLSHETLEEIRLLTNFETSDQKLLQVVLAGQNDLSSVLNREDLRQLKQRIEVRMDLKPLALNDIKAYMNHRWTYAGGSDPLPFAEDAFPLIAKGSKGIPRLVNSICDNSLLIAYASDERTIGAPIITQVLKDFDLFEPERLSNRVNGHAHPAPPLSLTAGPTSSGDERPPSQQSSIAPRSFLAIDDDELPASFRPSLARRLVNRMRSKPEKQ